MHPPGLEPGTSASKAGMISVSLRVHHQLILIMHLLYTFLKHIKAILYIIVVLQGYMSKLQYMIIIVIISDIFLLNNSENS